ncbi:MAG: M15 family metallopeptidase [Oscillospiraceae bacterium]|nr:M15 family metallopeptidase [Oscillospiraceae bacterium]
MKKTFYTAAFLAAAMMLTACSRTDKTDPNAVVVQGSGGSVEEPSLPEAPQTIVDGKLDADKLHTVKSGEVLRVADGETLLINGRLLCNNGGKVVVEKGGSLMVNGEIELSGELELLGEMALSEDAKVYGEGAMTLSSFDDIDCKGSFKAKIIPPEPVVTDGITTVGGVLIVNKKIALPETYGPGLDKDALAALKKMREGSGYDMPVISGFRSYEYQKTVFKGWCDRDGEEIASTYSARPGHSEHQSGLAMDISYIDQEYGETEEGKWVAAHCHEYGFIIRYQLGKDDITGYMYEPWHLRYLGESTARLVFDSGLTLDEFLGVES